jgi:hypothetical protein
MKSFVDKIPGLHRPKLDRENRILAYSQSLQDTHPFCELDEFLATVLAPQEVQALANRHAIDALWDQLQNAPLELPALWAVDAAAGGKDEDGDAPAQPLAPSLLFPSGFPWQFIEPARGRLALMGQLLRELSALGWGAQLNSLALCVLSLYQDHAGDDDCIELLELLVGQLPHRYSGAIYAPAEDLMISTVDKEVFALFRRCWPTMSVFRLSEQFWSSPWWTTLCHSGLSESLIRSLARDPVAWRVRPTPFEGPQATALIDWLKALTQTGPQEIKNLQWIAQVYRLASVSGNPQFIEALKALVDPMDNQWEVSHQEEYQLLLEHIQRADLSDEDLLWVVQGFYRRVATSEQPDARAWKALAHLHSCVPERISSHPAYRSHLLRCCLRATVQSPPNVSAEAAREIRQEAVAIYCDAMSPQMDPSEWRLLCRCWPWMPRYLAEFVADVVDRRVTEAYAHIGDGEGVDFLSPLLSSPTLGLEVALHLSRWSRRRSDGLQILACELSDRMKAGVRWMATDVSLLSDLACAEGTEPRLDAKVLQAFLDPWRQRLGAIQPPFADAKPSKEAIDQWLGRFGEAFDRKGVKECGDGALLLALVRRFGDWTLFAGADLSTNGDLVAQFADGLLGFAGRRWGARVLLAEVAICYLMPLVTRFLEMSNSSSECRQLLIRTRTELLAKVQEQAESDSSPYEREAYAAKIAQVLAVIDVMPVVWGGAYLSDAGDTEPAPIEEGAKDVRYAYQLVARASLGFHLGSGPAEAALCEMRLRMAEATLQGRNDTASVLAVVLFALERFSPVQPTVEGHKPGGREALT